MKLTVVRPIGGSRLTIEIEDRDDKTGLSKALFFTEPDVCGKCGANNILWTSHRAKAKAGSASAGQTFTYIVRVCVACRAESQAGDYVGGGQFWKAWGHRASNGREPGDDQ